MRDIVFQPALDVLPEDSEIVKIVESFKVKGSIISFATKVDCGFTCNLVNNMEHVGKFIDLEIDPITNILTIHFETKK